VSVPSGILMITTYIIQSCFGFVSCHHENSAANRGKGFKLVKNLDVITACFVMSPPYYFYVESSVLSIASKFLLYNSVC
jgi:hypothetical protein